MIVLSGVMYMNTKTASAPTTHETLVIILAEGGVVSTDDLQRLLSDKLGPIASAAFVPLPHEGNVVRWMADEEDGGTASGRLVVHVSTESERVTVWAEIVVDGANGVVASGPSPDRALDDVADRARRLVHQLRTNPSTPTHEIVGALVGIVDAAEQHLDDEHDHEAMVRRVVQRYETMRPTEDAKLAELVGDVRDVKRFGELLRASPISGR